MISDPLHPTMHDFARPTLTGKPRFRLLRTIWWSLRKHVPGYLGAAVVVMALAVVDTAITLNESRVALAESQETVSAYRRADIARQVESAREQCNTGTFGNRRAYRICSWTVDRKDS